jgi:hypothetical protein
MRQSALNVLLSDSGRYEYESTGPFYNKTRWWPARISRRKDHKLLFMARNEEEVVTLAIHMIVSHVLKSFDRIDQCVAF